jgi:hypothetical protein
MCGTFADYSDVEEVAEEEGRKRKRYKFMHMRITTISA